MDYKLWDYVKDVYKEDVSTSPLHLNYRDAAVMKSRLHQRVWKIMGAVVQIVYYGQYNPYTGEYSDPLILESWDWTLDRSTHFAIARAIQVQCFSTNGFPIAESKELTVKYYATNSERMQEIQRRHQNLVYDVKETTLRALVLTETGGDTKAAIKIGSIFIGEMNEYIMTYITDGLPTFLEIYSKPETLRQFPWLTNDLALLGYPGKNLSDIISGLLGGNIDFELDKIDRTALFMAI